jgi:hypothetical protein
MTDLENQKVHIERAIERARDGVGDRIDELDQRLRSSLDVKSQLREHAPQIMAGGAAVGFLVGFGFPSIFKKVLKVGVPIALVSLAVMKARGGADGDSDPGAY